MKRTRLSRVLGLSDLSILSSASMAPAYSIASTFGLMVAAAGSGAILSLIALSIPIVFIAIAFHRLCEDQSDAGSTYAWSRVAFGYKPGAFAAWIVVLSYFFAAVAAVVPAGIYTLELLSSFGVLPAALVNQAPAVAIAGGCWVLVASALLIGGMRPTARATGLFLLLEVAALMLFAVIAAFHHPAPAVAASHSHLMTLGARGMSGFLAAMVLSIWVTDGWEVSSYASEENVGTSRQPGLGGLVGLLITVAIVVVCMAAYSRVSDLASISSHAADTLAFVAVQLGGGWKTTVMVITVLVSTAATLWTTQLGISRGIFSMARDRVFPQALSAVHPSFGTPHLSILAVNVGVLAVTLLTGLMPSANEALLEVVNASSIFLGLTFILTGLACVVHFRRKGFPVTDLTRVVLPAIGTIAVTALLVFNFASQSRVDQWIALGGIAIGVVFAAVPRLPKPAAPRYRVPAA
ncbi:MAG: APC family permease [Candidatus Eremiobacteraeota bacterium]|nr:APC family permease [Candidatus Eremiobacteraeota bacterium]